MKESHWTYCMTVKTSRSSLGSASSAARALFCCPFGIPYAFSKSFQWLPRRLMEKCSQVKSQHLSRPTNSSLTVCPGLGVRGTSPEAERERERERERDSIMKHHHITGQCISKPQGSMRPAAVWLALAVSGERERTDSACIRTAAVRYQSHTPNTSAHTVLQKWATLPF